jgi:hypothetical protein
MFHLVERREESCLSGGLPDPQEHEQEMKAEGGMSERHQSQTDHPSRKIELGELNNLGKTILRIGQSHSGSDPGEE